MSQYVRNVPTRPDGSYDVAALILTLEEDERIVSVYPLYSVGTSMMHTNALEALIEREDPPGIARRR